MTDPFSDDTLLARWLAGELTEAEEANLRAHPDFPAFERLARASERLRLPAYDTEAGYARLRERTAGRIPQTRHLRPRNKWLRYAVPAAVAVLLLLTGRYLWSDDSQTIQAAAGEVRSVELAEGTAIRLHAGSELGYTLGRNERQTQLAGEAYFDVARDPDRPFEVVTDLGKVTVLGTSFNVVARADILRVTCSEGRVRVTPFGRDTSYVVPAGNQVELDPDGLATVERVDTTAALDWLDGRSTFAAARLSEVIEEIQEQYGISIYPDSAIDLTQRITTRFDHSQDVDEVVQTVFSALPGVTTERSGEVVRVKMRR